MSQTKLNDLISMEKDIISHPSNDLDYLKDIFKILNKDDIDNINSALNIILSDEKLSEGEKNNLLENSWKINHKFKPPSPTEFVKSDYWIGAMSEDIFPYVEKNIVDFFNPLNNKNTNILYNCIGWGKSTAVGLMKLYRAIYTLSLRNPKKFFKLAKSTRLTDITISLTKSTAYDLVLKPLITILETSSAYEKLRYERDMTNPQYTESGKILWCNTSKGNSMIRIGDIYFDMASDPMDLVGRNVLSFSCTEMSFLCEEMPEERVIRLMEDGINRVNSRFGVNNPNTTIIIDSSPNSMEGLADQWIAKHKDDKNVLFTNDSKWEVQPWHFPIWQKTHETFTMFKGDSTRPCKIISKEEEKNFTENELIKMPIDIYEVTKDNPSKLLKDYGAVPSGGVDLKLISNFEIIEDSFNPNLKGFLMFHHAPTSLPSEGLLWNIVKNAVFTYSGIGNKYTFWRNPNAERFVSIDLAQAHDMACIAMVHLEQDIHGQKIYVVDFVLPIMATKEEINMDSFRYLISDMCKYGNINIKHASLDGFQSSTTIQYLNRIGIDCDKLSVDYPIEPYMTFISNLTQRRIKIPRSIVVKNNLKSLIKAKTQNGKGIHDKIDHVKGEWCDFENTDWESSKLGFGGKDALDSIVGACTLADLYGTLDPQYIYNEEEIECLVKKDIKSFEKDILSKFGLKAKVS